MKPRCTCEQLSNGVVSGQVDPPAPAGRLWDPLCEKHLPKTKKQLQQTRSALENEAFRLEKCAYALRERSDQIYRQLQKHEYNCPCVRLNKDIDIFDMSDQEIANRNGFGCGWVSECLSARRDCPQCHGKGKS